MIAFDSDVLICAADRNNPYYAQLNSVFSDEGEGDRVGSVILMPEVLAKPMREGVDSEELSDLADYLSRVDLRPVDETTAKSATVLAAQYKLRAVDAIHLATAVAAGADYFLTDNRKDFPKSITEVDVIYPDDLPLAA